MLNELVFDALGSWATSRLMRVLLIVGAVAVSACDRAQLLAPSNSTVTVTVDAAVVPSSGSTQVLATLLEQAGTPVQNGTTVRFTTNLGRVEPVEAQTRNGVARTTFYADGASGVAQVRAASGAASGGTGDNTTGTARITIGSSAVAEGGVTVRANPGIVPAAGGTVEIVATATGANNDVMPGVVVAFATNHGALNAAVATTDSQGQARVLLTTNRETKVVASVGAKTGEVTVAVRPPAAVTLEGVTAAPAGQPVAVTVKPATGTAPRVVLSWGDGTQSDLGLVSVERRATHVYANAGSYTISATATEGDEINVTTAVVTVAPRPSPTISSSPTDVTTASVVTFTVKAGTGGAGLQGMRIEFGDGNARDLGTSTENITVQYRYTEAGTYTARAIQTDGAGFETSSSAVIIVTQAVAPAPTVTPTPSSGITAGAVVSFSVTASTSGPGLRSLRIDFGDGTQQDLGASSLVTVQHRYSTAGTYVVQVTQTNVLGVEGVGVLVIIVN